MNKYTHFHARKESQVMCCEDECGAKIEHAEWEAEIQKKLPEAICLAKTLIKKCNLKPRVALHAAASQVEIPEWKLEEECVRLALL